MESEVNLPLSNRLGVLTGSVAAAMLTASLLALPAVASTITFETANLGAFTSPITEDGFTYSKLSGHEVQMGLAHRQIAANNLNSVDIQASIS